MGAERKTLLTIEVVTDHDTGEYYIGEVDWSEHAKLNECIQKRGADWVRKEFHRTLVYWLYETERRARELKDPRENVETGSGKMDATQAKGDT